MSDQHRVAASTGPAPVGAAAGPASGGPASGGPASAGPASGGPAGGGSAGGGPAGGGPSRIAEFRDAIDGLDRQIIALLAERTRIVRQLTVFKNDEATVRSPDRVGQVLGRVHDLAQRNGMPPEVAVATYRALIEELTRMQLAMLADRRKATASGQP